MPERQPKQTRASHEGGASPNIEDLKAQKRREQEERVRLRLERLKGSSSPAWSNSSSVQATKATTAEATAHKAVSTSAVLSSKRSKQTLLYENFVIDCDGVMWHGDEPIEGSFEACQKLLKLGCKLHFITNSSGKTREAVVQKLRTFGLNDINEDMVTTSGSAAARMISQDYPAVKKVYAVGEAGLVHELERKGLSVEGGADDDRVAASNDAEFVRLQLSDEVQMVVCGLDRSFNYAKLCKASLYLQRGCPLICTNYDAYDVFPSKGNQPGAGCIIAAIKASYPGVEAKLAGKPSGELLMLVMNDRKMDKARTIMIGDRVDTDIQLAHNAGVASCLVLTGVSSRSEGDSATKCHDSLSEFVQTLGVV